MNLTNIGENKVFNWGLIFTFIILWFIVATVSTLHAITFFSITNPLSLSIFLGIAYELGQAAVLFSILMTRNREKLLSWALMILLTGLQITANVYASFKYMSNSGSEDWIFWQKSILFGVDATSPEMYQIIISWISGALLPIVALGMTALVAQNIRLMGEEKKDIVIPADDTTLKIQEKINDEVEEIQEEIQEDDEFNDLEELEITNKQISEIPKEDEVNLNIETNVSEPLQELEREMDELVHNLNEKAPQNSPNEPEFINNDSIAYVDNGVEVLDVKANEK